MSVAEIADECDFILTPAAESAGRTAAEERPREKWSSDGDPDHAFRG